MSWARRSKFCAVTYSSACRRVSRLTRLPTTTLPATAPTRGLEKCLTRWRERVGAHLGVGVDADEDLGIGVADRGVERAPLAVVELGEDPDAPVGRELLDLFERVVGRAVVDDDHSRNSRSRS
jgi:hypothetical protein